MVKMLKIVVFYTITFPLAGYGIGGIVGLARLSRFLKLVGMENFPKQSGRIVLVSNHPSMKETFILPGLFFRPCVIEPAFHKFARQRCGALQLHVTDRRAFHAYRTGISVLVAVKSLWPDAFAWRAEPYEFRDDVPAIDLLTGTAAVRKAIDDGADIDSVMRIARTGTEAYDAGRSRALLYG